MKRAKYPKLVLLLIVLFLSGCSLIYKRDLVENEDFFVITANSSDSYESLARKYLGDASQASLIEQFNPTIKLQNGSRIAIPKHSIRPGGFYSNGYQNIPILCYHQFTTAKTSSNRTVVPVDEFRSQMAYLYENNFNIIDLEQLRQFIDGEIDLPKKSVVITVDDGYKSFLDLAFPILQDYNFHSTMFVYPDFVGGRLSLSWDQIRELERHDLVSIESHSKTHSNLSVKGGNESLSQYKARLRNEVVLTDKILKREIGRSSSFFAYPFGDSSEQLIQILKAQDYALAFTVKRGSNAAFSSRYLLHRSMIFGDHSLDEFKKNLKTFSKVSL